MNRAAPKAPSMTTAELMAALRAHYVPPTDIADRLYNTHGESELLVEEVCAPGSGRRIDLLRIGIWQSRGNSVIAHELKVNRSDWLRELAQPAKAEAWWPFCHEFWVVAPDHVVIPEELPTGWGLMVPPSTKRAKRFRVVKAAARKTPKLTPALLVEIGRRIDNARLGEIARLNQEREAIIDKRMAAERRKAKINAIPRDTQHRLELLARLEDALGTRLDDFGYGTPDKLNSVTPDELAALLKEYGPEHVALQRRRKELEGDTERLRQVAEVILGRTQGLAAAPKRSRHVA